RLAPRLWGLREIALLLVFLERHLAGFAALCRLGLLPRTGCGLLRSPLAGGLRALAERVHQARNFRLGPRLRSLDLAALHLCLDQLGQRLVIAIVELARVEAAGLGADDVLGEVEHLALDLH